METTCIYIYLPISLTRAGSSSALLRFIGSVSNLPLLTVGGYYYYYSYNKMMERKMVTGTRMVWVLVGVTDCVPQPRGIAWLHNFSCPYQLRTIRCFGF
jgi:hypothetical protein